MIRKLVIVAGSILSAVGVLLGCQTAGNRQAMPEVPASRAAAAWPESELQAGRSLYLNKCTRCHKFHDPAEYDFGEWDEWMTRMSRKAKLHSDQQSLLRRYLGLYRERELVNANVPAER